MVIKRVAEPVRDPGRSCKVAINYPRRECGNY